MFNGFKFRDKDNLPIFCVNFRTSKPKFGESGDNPPCCAGTYTNSLPATD